MRTVVGAGIAIGAAFVVLGACASFGSNSDGTPANGDAGGDAADDAPSDGGVDAPPDAPPPCTPAPPPVRCADDAGVVCPDGCKDTTSDSANCGRCGRVCAGGCIDGACEAELLIGAAGPNVRIGAVNTTHVFFRADDGSAVMRIPVTGSVTPDVFYANDAGVLDVAADDNAAFVLTSTDVVGVQLTGNTSASIHRANPGPGGRIALTADRVFWTDGASGGGVYDAARDGSSYVQLASSLTHAPTDIGVSQGEVVFLEQAGNMATDGVIASADATQASSATAQIGDLTRGDLVVHGDDVVYTTSDKVWLASRVDFSHVAIATVAAAEHVAVDDAWVYFSGTVDAGGGYGIWRVSRCGGPIEPMVSGVFGGNLTSMRVAGGHLYWHGQDVGIYRVAK